MFLMLIVSDANRKLEISSWAHWKFSSLDVHERAHNFLNIFTDQPSIHLNGLDMFLYIQIKKTFINFFFMRSTFSQIVFLANPYY